MVCANQVSMATLTCGSLDNVCAATITVGLGDLSDTSNGLVAAVSDCISSPFLCTYDTITIVNNMNAFVGDVITAVGVCNVGAQEPSAYDLDLFFGSQMQN